MARPRKNNADYFSHDKTMRNDSKIKAVRIKFGNEGHSIWCQLLETLTDCEDFRLVLANQIDWEILAGDFMIDVVLLKQIIDYFIKLKLIIKDGTNYICPNLIKRLEPLLEERERKREWRENKEMGVKDGTNQIKDGTNPKNPVANPQSKVKESKVKNKELAIASVSPEDLDTLSLNGKKPRTTRDFTNARRAEIGNPPMQKKPLSESQIDFINRSKLIFVFKKAVNENLSKSYFEDPDDIEDLKNENSKINVGIKRFWIRCKKDFKKASEVIEWFAGDYGEWCNWKPAVCFRKDTVVDFENKEKPKKNNLTYYND